MATAFTRTILFCGVAIAALLAAGCATRDYNSLKAQTNKGYADFYADPQSDLYWDIYEFNEKAHGFRRLYAELQAPSAGILRLPLEPGRHRLQVNFLNLPLTAPAGLEVEIERTKVTPVMLKITELRAATASDRSPTVRVNARGRAAYVTRIDQSGSALYRATAEASSPVPFQGKDATGYWTK